MKHVIEVIFEYVGLAELSIFALVVAYVWSAWESRAFRKKLDRVASHVEQSEANQKN